jgi:CHAT domain-containing protein
VADIFISYAQEDRAWAENFARALESRGWTVWWDRQIVVGEPFDEVIERQLAAARCAVVIWSLASGRSRWVRSEAAAAEKRGILVPVAIDDAQPPLGYDILQAAKLSDWKPDAAHAEFDRCTTAIATILEKPPASPTAPARRMHRRALGVVIALLVIAGIAAAWLQTEAGRRLLLRRAIAHMTSTTSVPPKSRFTASPEPSPTRVVAASVARTEISDAAVEVLRRAQDCPKDRIQATAFVRVVEGAPDQAVKLLSDASATTADGTLRSDLAAAQYEAAVAGKHEADLVKALTAADGALQLDASLPAARFNRALITEEMGLVDPAVGAWRNFLGVDAKSAWSEIARKRMSALEQSRGNWDTAREALLKAIADGDGVAVKEIVRTYHQEARRYGEKDILGEWGEQIADRGIADLKLGVARAIGDALRDTTREAMLADAVTEIDRASREGGVRVALLAAAHVAYWRGTDPPDLPDELALAHMLAKQRASALASRGEFAKALVSFEDLLSRERADFPTHRSFIAELHWSIAFCRGAQSRWSEAIVDAMEARRIFTALGEHGNAGAVDALVADIFDYLGQPDRAWRHRVPAFRMASSARDEHRLRAALESASRAELHAHHWAEAIALINLEAEIAAALVDREALAAVMARRARARLQQGDLVAARRDTRDARALTRQPNLDLDHTEGILVRDQNPARSAGLLTRAIELARSTQPADLPDLFHERALSLQRFAPSARVEEDLRAGIAEIERRTRSLKGLEMRAVLLDLRETLVDELMRLLLSAQRLEEAFELAEYANELAIHDSATPAALVPAKTLDRLRRNLAEDTVVVAFHPLPEKLVIFRIDARSLRVSYANASRPQLESASKEILAAMQRRESVRILQRRAAALHDLLFGGVDLSSARRLIIVANDVLQLVPFAALYNRSSGRYLIELASISVAPSASLFLATAEHDRALRRQSGSASITIVAEPDVREPGFSRLPGSDIEARRIVALYANATLLTGADATEERFVSALKRSQIVHFAGHAISNEIRPEISRLMLTPDAKEDGSLHAAEIADLRLDRTRLVVLSTCNTMPTENAARKKPGIATSFLLAGVPTVVTALGSVDDRTDHMFVTRLHASIARGASPADAARMAQLGILRQGMIHPSEWGLFEVLGGNTADIR